MVVNHPQQPKSATPVWECACGELFNQAIHAIRCRKCRVYAPTSERYAWNLETEEKLTREDIFPTPEPTPEQLAYQARMMAILFPED